MTTRESDMTLEQVRDAMTNYASFGEAIGIPPHAFKVWSDAIDAHLIRCHQALFTGTIDGKHVGLHGTKESVEALEEYLTRTPSPVAVSDEDV